MRVRKRRAQKARRESRVDWRRSRWMWRKGLSGLNFPGEEGMLSRWDIVFKCDISFNSI